MLSRGGPPSRDPHGPGGAPGRRRELAAYKSLVIEKKLATTVAPATRHARRRSFILYAEPRRAERREVEAVIAAEVALPQEGAAPRK